MLIEIVKINTTGTQSRVTVNGDVVAEYAQAIEDGQDFPPVAVYQSGDGQLWLADGFHRLAAHVKAGKTEIAATVQDGGQRAAILHSVGANASHGLRRTNADKRRAVEMLLSDPEWAQWSDREIGRFCRVSQPFVSSIRGHATDNVISEQQERTYTTKHGTQSTMAVDGINAGRKQAPAPTQAAVSDVEERVVSHGDFVSPAQADPVSDERDHQIDELEQQLREVSDGLADAMAALDDLQHPERDQYLSEMAKLRAELHAVTESRDALMNENAALKKHIRMLEKQIKK